MRWLRGKARALINALLLGVIVALYVAVSTPAATFAISRLYDSPIYRGHAKGVVALECAVSWNAAAIPEILDTLLEQDVRITFFVSGEWAQENSELLLRMVREGHEIGTMGMAPALDGGTKSVAQDIEQAALAISRACGVQPRMYHSGTRLANASGKAARRLGMRHVLCTVDLLSGRGDAQDILLRALDTLFDGSILLMQPTAEAAKALPAVLEGLKQAGYKAGTVSDALGETGEKEIRV